jgi:hypothetical protein
MDNTTGGNVTFDPLAYISSLGTKALEIYGADRAAKLEGKTEVAKAIATAPKPVNWQAIALTAVAGLLGLWLIIRATR